MGRAVWKCTAGSGSERGTLNGQEGDWLWRSWTSQEARMSINRTQESLCLKDGRQGGEEGHASLPAYLRRNMLEVTRVGSFYSFTPVMCWVGPEQAGVLFSRNGAQWIRGSSPAAALPGTLPCGGRRGPLGPRAAGTLPSPYNRLLAGEPQGSRAGCPASRCWPGLSWFFSVPYGWCQGGRWWQWEKAGSHRSARRAGVGTSMGAILWGTYRRCSVLLVTACQGSFRN